MKRLKSAVRTSEARAVLIGLFLFLYVIGGFYTQLGFIDSKHLPGTFFQDFGYYERALRAALAGQDPYAVHNIGQGFLYPPQALLIIELFSRIQPAALKVAVFSATNITLLALIVYGVSRHYGYPIRRTWYWYILCLGFAPLYEMLQQGQINIVLMFGLFVLFVAGTTAQVLGGIGLALAVLTKVSPLLFVGYAAANRQYKTLIAAAVAGAALTVLSVVRYGLSPLLRYPAVFQWLATQFSFTKNQQALVAKLSVIARARVLQAFTARLPGALQLPMDQFAAFAISQYRLIQTGLFIYILLVIVISGLCTYYFRQPREPMFIITGIGMTLAPNIIWYHHYVFLLLPVLIWMGWSGLNRRVVAWCLLGLFVAQLDRWLPPYGLFIHLFGHISIIALLAWQIRQVVSSRQAAGVPSQPPEMSTMRPRGEATSQ